jgi:hypothetical protein
MGVRRQSAVNVAVPDSALYVAVIVAVPVFTAVACPAEPAALDTVATLVSELDHVADAVTSAFVPSL